MRQLSSAQELIAYDEGEVDHVYKDSLGYWTIGVGHLVDAVKGGSLPKEIVDALFNWDRAHKETELRAAIPWYDGLDDVRKAALLDMAFNLGTAGLLGFRQTLAAIRAGDYVTASTLMLQSRWATQLPVRANRISQMIKTGQWPQVP